MDDSRHEAPAPPHTHRLFFALQPEPLLLQSALAPLWRRARAAGFVPIPLSTAHLTLIFVGAVIERLHRAIEAADTVAAAGFSLTLDRLGYWPAGGVIWLGSRTAPEPLMTLAEQLRKALKAQDLPVSAQPFVPHVTLVRRARHPWDPAPWHIHWPVDHFVLLESVARGGIPSYIVRRRFPLAP